MILHQTPRIQQMILLPVDILHQILAHSWSDNSLFNTNIDFSSLAICVFSEG